MSLTSLSMYSGDDAAVLATVTDVDCSFHDAAVAFECALNRAAEAQQAAREAQQAARHEDAYHARAVHLAELSGIVRSILLLRWPVAGAEWVKGL